MKQLTYGCEECGEKIEYRGICPECSNNRSSDYDYDDDDDHLCPDCNGSGEGKRGKTICWNCHGKGTVKGTLI